MIVDSARGLHDDYPKGSIWGDSSSYNGDENKMDYYVMFDSWKFVGRYESWIEALEGFLTNDH